MALVKATLSNSPHTTNTQTTTTKASDEELEQRLAKLRLAKGATPDGQGAKEKKRTGNNSASGGASTSAPAATAKPVYDYSSETLYYEGPPHRGDLALNLALGTTLVWLPLTAAALGRGLFVNYRFTDRRLSVQTTAPWKVEQSDVAYQEVRDVVTAPRAFGAWGDMVVVLKDGSKIEIRSLDRYKELKDYILARRDALGGKPSETVVAAGSGGIMDLDADDDVALGKVKAGSGGKGFSA